MGSSPDSGNHTRSVALLAGGVGGARLARGLAAVLDPDELTVIVNVGDDDTVYGLDVSPDLDTVLYTLAGMEGPEGWGRAGDTFRAMEALAPLVEDTSFRIGDADLATHLARTAAQRHGMALSQVTAALGASLGVRHRVLPVTDDPLRTRITTAQGETLSFQDYFVRRRQRDEVQAIEFTGADGAKPAPGVEDALAGASLLIIAPSNPPLSIWPMLAVPAVGQAVAAARAVAVSPLIGGRPVKGPADRVMASLGLPGGTAGVLAAYRGLLRALVVDEVDAADADLAAPGVEVVATDTRIVTRAGSARLASWLLERW